MLSRAQLALLWDSVMLIAVEGPWILLLAPTAKCCPKATGCTGPHPALKGSRAVHSKDMIEDSTYFVLLKVRHLAKT